MAKRKNIPAKKNNRLGCAALFVIIFLAALANQINKPTGRSAEATQPTTAAVATISHSNATRAHARPTNTTTETPQERTAATETPRSTATSVSTQDAFTVTAVTLAPQSVALAQLSRQDEQVATVTRIIDGDTIEVKIGEVGFRVRYIGIDTPERGETCFDQATEANRTLVEGRTIRMERDVSNTDRYGRLLRYVYVGNTFVNANLVADGWARAYPYSPDTSRADEFAALEAEARADNRGCHRYGVFRRATPTPRPTSTAAPTREQAKTYYVASQQTINVRAEPSTNASVIGGLAPGSAVEVLGEVEGIVVSGSAMWSRIVTDGQEAYVHSSLLSDTPISHATRVQTQPVQQQQIQQQQPVQQQPVQQPPVVQPTQPPPPAPPPVEPPAPAGPVFTCNCSKTCTAMLSCEEAYFQLNQCGCGARDGDGDGVPCESICPGG